MLQKVTNSHSQSQQEKEKKLNLIQVFYNLPEQAVSIINYLLRIDNKFKHVWPSQQTIANSTGLCRATVNRWCIKLSDMGIFRMLFLYKQSNAYIFDDLFNDLSFRARISHIFSSCRFVPLHHIYMKGVTLLYKLKEVTVVKNPYCPFFEREFVLEAPVIPQELLCEVEKWQNDLENESRIASIYDKLGEIPHGSMEPGTNYPNQGLYPGDDCLCTQGVTGECGCGDKDRQPISLLFGCL